MQVKYQCINSLLGHIPELSLLVSVPQKMLLRKRKSLHTVSEGREISFPIYHNSSFVFLWNISQPYFFLSSMTFRMNCAVLTNLELQTQMHLNFKVSHATTSRTLNVFVFKKSDSISIFEAHHIYLCMPSLLM